MINEKNKRIKRIILVTLGIALCALVYILLSFWGLKIPCMFNKITGLECPGCGTTRAVKSLLQLDIRQAFEYNYLFPLQIGYIAWVYIKACHHYIKKKIFSYTTPHISIDISILLIIIIWGIVRNILKI